MTDTTITFNATFSPRQTLAWELLHRADVSEVLYGGGKGGGKSVFSCIWVYLRALEIIQECQIKPSDTPPPIAWIGRKRLTDFKDTTLETWKRFIPRGTYEIKEQAREIVIGNTVKIVFGGLDQPGEVEKFNSSEYAYFFVDQAEETTQDDISGLRASLRLLINGHKPAYKGLWTANPAQCWLKKEFITAPDPGHHFVKALPADNPWLGTDYQATLRKSFQYRPELLEAYLHGSWDAFEGADQIIKSSWFRRAREKVFVVPKHKRRCIVVDVARFGDDETVCYYFEETKLIESEIYGQKDTMHTANTVFLMWKRLGKPVVGIDVNGVGAGVYDRLFEMGVNAVPIDSAAASQDERFGNMRADMWWTTGERFAAEDIEYNVDDDLLEGQLTTVKYRLKNGMIYVEDKKEIKKRLGRSPDRGDAYIYGQWLIQQTQPDNYNPENDYADAGSDWRTA